MSKGRRRVGGNPGANRTSGGSSRAAGGSAIATHTQTVMQAEAWSGPLPRPGDLQAYNAVVPGSAAQIMAAVRSQAEHRQRLEYIVISGSERRANRGQLIAAALVFTVVACGFIVAIRSNGYAGAAVIAAGLGSAVALYVIGGRPPNQQDNDSAPPRAGSA